MDRRFKQVLGAILFFAWAFAAVAIAGAAEGDKAISEGLTGLRVETELAGLLADEAYSYDESSLDDPAWLMAIREWLRQLWERWDRSPLNIATGAGFTLIGLILSVLVVLVIVGLLLPRLIAQRFGGSGAEGTIGAGEDYREGSWGEAGARKAMELASSGMHREAVSVLFGSALRGLDNMGWIHFRKSHPSRSYLRQLRRSAELYPVFRDFLGRFEVAYYRKAMPDGDDWTFMYDRYTNLARVATTIRPPAYVRRR